MLSFNTASTHDALMKSNAAICWHQDIVACLTSACFVGLALTWHNPGALLAVNTGSFHMLEDGAIRGLNRQIARVSCC